MDNTETTWFKLLTLFDEVNHLVKQGDWYREDVEDFYKRKDEFLKIIAVSKPQVLKVNYYYVPYIMYSKTSKDKAGDLMRKDSNKQPFEYYLSQIEPGPDDIVIPEKATVELVIECSGRTFIYHIPRTKTKDWPIDWSQLEKKVWISGKEFHKRKYNKLKMEIERLMGEVNDG